MRVLWGTVLLLAGSALAQGDPFTAPPRESFRPAAPGAYERCVESLALCKAILARDPANLLALERATALLEHSGTARQLIPNVREALKWPGLDEKHRDALRGLLGHLIRLKWNPWGGMGRGRVIIFPAQPPGGGNAEIKEGVEHLRAAIRARPKDTRSRDDLATLLELLDAEKNRDEAQRLRIQADAIRDAERPARPKPVRHDQEAGKLLRQAEALEQQGKPDHAGALRLRRQALVLVFCSHTIPFQYSDPLYEPVSRLATNNLVTTNLTRTYLTRKGDVGQVPPQHYPTPAPRQIEIVRGLAEDPGAVAVLLAIVTARREVDVVVEAALEALVKGNHEPTRAHLPRLIGMTLFARHAPAAQRDLVRLAARLGVKEAAPLLVAELAEDTDVFWPRDLARALGALGRPADADALLALARSPGHDVYFRRQAIAALGRVAPARLKDVPDEPHLELALAAARYRHAPTEALKGRIFAAFGHEHEADDAARYCVELDLRDAVPSLERFLATREKHYAADAVRDALKTLLARVRDAN